LRAQATNRLCESCAEALYTTCTHEDIAVERPVHNDPRSFAAARLLH
jgi:uncharacterized protein (DUF934 family)